MGLLHQELTDAIIRCFYNTYNELGYGFLEKVYEKAFSIELAAAGLKTISQMTIKVHYHNQIVGEYFADLCIENRVIIEIKAADRIDESHEAQLVNYLKATNIEVGLLMNFGPKPEFVRRVFMNQNKKICADPLNPRHPRSIEASIQ